ncbi:MAG: anti-sigma factor [Caldilineaceae bacterium]
MVGEVGSPHWPALGAGPDHRCAAAPQRLVARANRMLQQQQATLLVQIAEQREAIGLLSDDAVNRTEIFGVVDDGEAKVSVIWNDAFSVAILYAEGLPQLAPDEVYHVWLIDGEERTCGGLFDVDQLARARSSSGLPDRLDRYSAIGITSGSRRQYHRTHRAAHRARAYLRKDRRSPRGDKRASGYVRATAGRPYCGSAATVRICVATRPCPRRYSC